MIGYWPRTEKHLPLILEGMYQWHHQDIAIIRWDGRPEVERKYIIKDSDGRKMIEVNGESYYMYELIRTTNERVRYIDRILEG